MCITTNYSSSAHSTSSLLIGLLLPFWARNYQLNFLWFLVIDYNFETTASLIKFFCMCELHLQDLRSTNLPSTHRTSFSSTASDNDSQRRRGAEPAYSFVGMHCIFDQCKAAGISLCYWYRLLSFLLSYYTLSG